MQQQCITPYSSPEFGTIRTIEEDGAVMFCAKDICTVLGYANASDAIKKHCKGISKRYPLSTKGGTQMFAFIDEPDMIRLITRSKLPSAQRFEAWVYEEVLPSIRKRGAYISAKAAESFFSDPDTIIQIAQNWQKDRQLLIESQAENEALKAENDEMKPKALFADAVTTSKQSVLIGELAKILKGNGVKGMGQNRLFGWMRENGYLMKRGGHRNMPTQKAMELGLFEVKETSVTHSDGHVTISMTHKVTGKGQQYFVNKFLGEVA